MFERSERLKIFTWHIHGSYLYYLSQGDYDLYIPVDAERGAGYGGRGNSFLFGDNVIEVPAYEVKDHFFDCILFQSAKNYTTDQFDILSERQREETAKIYLEHDPPRKHPTDTIHILDNPEVTLVHVTPFNKLMWDNNEGNVKVIEHGVTKPAVEYSGGLEKGAVVINNLPERGRRLGADIFLELRKYIPLDLIGMNSKEFGGIGEVPLPQLPSFLSDYRFFFNPIRYTSLGLSVCEAMMLGMPVVGMATTEMVTVIENNVSGFIDTDPFKLIKKMEMLLQNKDLAIEMGKEAKRTAEQRFNIRRFTAEWEELFHLTVAGNMVMD